MVYLAGLFEHKIDPKKVKTEKAIPSGETVAVQALQEPLIEQATGFIWAKNETVISSRITAIIISVNIRAGDAVAIGDTLISLDNRELEARFQQQQQAVNAVQAQVAVAQPNYDRIKELFDRELASRADLDRVEAELRLANAELGRAQRGIDRKVEVLSGLTVGERVLLRTN